MTAAPASSSHELLQRDVRSGAEAKELICLLASNFYHLGWVTGTGGGLSIRFEDRIYMAPSGVQKEHMRPDMIFTLAMDGEVLDGPAPETGLRVSQCRPLFLEAYHQRQAGAVLHSHSLNAMLASLAGSSFQSTHMEMQKGLAGVGYHDVVTVPIIANTAQECELTDSLAEAMRHAEAHCHAILVQRHGVYVWGQSWIDAKRHAECYDYLFQAATELRRLGMDPTQAPAAI